MRHCHVPRAMSATIFAPAASDAMRDLHSSSLASVTLSQNIYVIGLAVGPLILSPLSECYGRMPIMHGTNLLFLVASVLCATSVGLPMLLIFRFASGAATVSLGGGYVADVMPIHLRQRAINLWTIGPVMVRSSPRPRFSSFHCRTSRAWKAIFTNATYRRLSSGQSLEAMFQ